MAPKVRIFNKHWHLPRSQPLRIGLGVALIVCGILGFLPVLGFWMIPLGFLVLSVDLPIVRRWRRQITIWWNRRRDRRRQRRDARRGKTGAEEELR